jgi:very-long-chain enoyl-CoA reductase
MRPRSHNIISYTVAALVFVGVALARGEHVGANLSAAPTAALLSAGMWCVHFVRRSLESAFVHRYTKPAVPVGDVVSEYIYYWGFAGWNAAALFSPSYAAPAPWQLGLGVLVFVLAELGNAKAHRMLAELRPDGSVERKIPRGFLFEWVSCPHYLCEIGSWVGFAIATPTWAAFGFLVVGAGILTAWARTRHRSYQTDFAGQEREAYPAQRRSLLPFIF